MLIFDQKSDVVRKSVAVAKHPICRMLIRSVVEAHRAVPLSYGKHIRGYHPIRPGHGRIPFESLIERDTMTALAKLPQLIKMEAQPLTVFFEADGVRHRYTPDIRVTLSEVPFELECLGFERVTLIECKPAQKLAKQRLELQRNFQAIRMAVDIPQVLILDEDLDKGLLEVRHDR